MKLGINLGYWGARPLDRFIEIAKHAEELGFDIVCTSEAYGSDAFTPLAAIAACTSRIKLGTAIMQISARTPASAAMTAITLDHISNGRLHLGVGVSGPQVVEGWYGQPFKKPLERTREWLAIFRKILAREEPLTFAGAQYQLPYTGPGSTAQGKALMSITHPLRKDLPVYLGAEGPKNVALAFESFDGWFPFLIPPDRFDMYGDTVDNRPADFAILQSVSFSLDPDPRIALLPVKKMLALYVGGMGSKEENFHKRVIERAGYADAAAKIQELWLGGRQKEAVMAVPDELADALSITGTPENIRLRLAAWKTSPATTLMIGVGENFEQTLEHMRVLAKEAA